MIYIILSVIGILALLAVQPKWNENTQVIFVVSSIFIGLATCLATWFILENTGVIEKGISSFWSQIPYLEIGLFFSMIVGMAAKYFYDAADAMGRKKKIVFHKWQFFKPMLVSPIVFGTIYANIQQNTSAILLLIFAFQNGFFWQTVLNKPMPLIETTNKTNI